MVSPQKTDEKQWFAARILGSDIILCKRLVHDGIHSYRTKYAPGIVFIRSTMKYATEIVHDYWGKLFFYLDPQRKFPERIPEKEMNNFILVTSVSDELIPLGEVSEELLSGDRVRVVSGLFEGAEGVVKRIKGDRRLVVSISSFTAVATCYIKPELLAKIQ